MKKIKIFFILKRFFVTCVWFYKYLFLTAYEKKVRHSTKN